MTPYFAGLALALVAWTVVGGEAADAFGLQSRSFRPGGPIPVEFAMRAVPGGRNESLELHWTAPPKNTRSFVLALVDHHPIAHDWVHWLVVDIPPSVRELPTGASGHLAGGARELRNSFGKLGYGGPQPPRGSGVHPYEATLYALSVSHLAVSADATWPAVSAAMRSHVLGQASVTGTFEQ
ncbi:MAG: YbhB/YbcL family Raf kinase inhibitor-like protein [Cyanobacteria bacterium REEB65]|nr:YbhB/YbcL family Raf kinase inhibitor-like protein [Cyanobacteria bacterium REEB65]